MSFLEILPKAPNMVDLSIKLFDGRTITYEIHSVDNRLIILCRKANFSVFCQTLKPLGEKMLTKSAHAIILKEVNDNESKGGEH